MPEIIIKKFSESLENFYFFLIFAAVWYKSKVMFSAPQQVLKNRRRLSALTTLQARIAENNVSANRFSIAKKQTQTLREFFEDLQVEENRIKREIQRIGQKIKRLENSNVDKKDNDNKTDGK
ncbi:uncharacterized protein LOC101458477 [Ceratitis capitata]|uniref:Uncharacterized protein n=1 Tax=Ceratitis capitata TaxID=7213 RepID=W8C781_CERCA|nr:uncharacterized protein LOC101458477 [Ceratitis capitata]